MENSRFEEVFSKCHSSLISQRNSKTKKGFSIYRPRAMKWDQIQVSSSICLEMATDQRIIFGIHLVKMRLLHAITKEGVFLKNGYTDYFFYFRIGFPMQNTAGNCWDTLSTMKMKLAATERKCAYTHSYGPSVKFQPFCPLSDAAWSELEAETDPLLLSGLLWTWIDQLKEPILTRQNNTS